jgi:initiation factor 1A
MVKNLKGGKGHKNLARKYNNVSEEQTKLRLREDEDEHYGIVETILGNGHFYVICDDDVKRLCRIGGKFKKRRRDNLVVKNGFVLIGIYGFETEIKDKIQKCDLMETYTDTELKRLMDKERDPKARRFIERAVNQQISEKQQTCIEKDTGFDFLTEEQILQREEFMQNKKIVSSSAEIVPDEDEIDIDEI